MADLTCGGSCMKTLLFIFNGIFFLGGAAMLGLGIWLLVDPNINSYFEHIIVTGSDTLFEAAAITVTVVGALIFVIGFFGCCGAIKESTCMLCVFVGLMSLIFALEIVAAVLAGVFHNEISEGLMEEMSDQARNVVEPLKKENNASSLAWHHMQADLFCCGGANYTDYKHNDNFKNTPATPVPKTCCMLKNDDLENIEPIDYELCKTEFLNNEPNPKQLFVTGCYVASVNWLESKAGILIGVAIGIAVIQLLGIIFACCVRNQLNRKKEYV